MRRTVLQALLLLALLAPIGCRGGKDHSKSKDGALFVFVSVAPQGWLARELGGDLVKVEVLVESGQSPATYDPSPRQVARLSEADLFFPIGVGFEKSLRRKIDEMDHRFTQVDVPDTISYIEIGDGDGNGNGNGNGNGDGDGDGHDHGLVDPHIWLDPTLMSLLAANMADAFIKARPEHAEVFAARLKAVQAKLGTLDGEVQALLAPYKGRRFLVYHGAYAYFARRYGLEQVAISIASKSPGARRIAEVMQQAESDSYDAVIVQSEFSDREASAIAAQLKVDVIEMNPLSADYDENLLNMARQLAKTLALKEERND
mgnify:CR=1 FL=1